MSVGGIQGRPPDFPLNPRARSLRSRFRALRTHRRPPTPPPPRRHPARPAPARPAPARSAPTRWIRPSRHVPPRRIARRRPPSPGVRTMGEIRASYARGLRHSRSSVRALRRLSVKIKMCRRLLAQVREASSRADQRRGAKSCELTNFRKNADTRRALAESAQGADRDTWLDIAAHWEHLAIEAERNPEAFPSGNGAREAASVGVLVQLRTAAKVVAPCQRR